MVHQIWNPYPEIKQGLEEVKKIILSELTPSHPAIYQKIHDYVEAPGKYLRSGFCLLLSLKNQGELSRGKLYLAAYIEVLHLATLIHDDVIDEADLRRNIPTFHTQFNNRIAIYTGDYLLAYAVRLAAKGFALLEISQEDRKSAIDQRLLERILAGELAQLMHQFNRQMTLKDYLKQIQGKTAILFGHAFQLGMFHATVETNMLKQAFRAGRAFGMAFQLRDDVIDYRLTQDISGKPALQDVINGIYTAPLLFAIKKDKTLLTDLEHLEKSEEKNLLVQRIAKKVEETGAVEETENLMIAYLMKTKQYLSGLNGFGQEEAGETFIDQLFQNYF